MMQNGAIQIREVIRIEDIPVISPGTKLNNFLEYLRKKLEKGTNIIRVV